MTGYATSRPTIGRIFSNQLASHKGLVPLFQQLTASTGLAFGMPSSVGMSAATLWLHTRSLQSVNARTTTASPQERKNLSAARLDNTDAFVQIVLPYAPGLYRRALRITGSVADAEDAHQEALLKAFSRLHQFAGQKDDAKDDLHAWVSRITTNASIDVIRQRREGRFISLEEPGQAPDETLASRLAARGENPEEQYAKREMRRRVAHVIARLTPELRKVCLLRDVLQYSTQEVADRLGISTVAVRLRLFRAHRRLREGLRDFLLKRRTVARRAVQPACLKPNLQARSEEFSSVSAQPEFACGD
jgi:RNA polymerase sigma-70 factor, ECF subfamily